MKDLINGQPEQDIEHCATCIHAADSEDICILRKCKYAIAELKDCYEPKQSEQRWIPVTERMPEEDTEVLISYRYKEGEGDTDHVNIDITSYGTTCFGGREIHTLKEWRQPFDYFHANYEVIAWMPLPEPYREEA